MNTRGFDDGFTIEDPALLIPWGLSKKELVRLLGPYGVKQVLPHVYTLSCTALNGLPVKLNICFDSHYGSKKYMISFDQREQCELHQSFEEFQRHLETTFGEPTTTKPGEEGFPDYEWIFGRYSIRHGVYEYRNLLEAVTISPQYQPTGRAAELFDSSAIFCRFVLIPLVICPLVITLLIYWIVKGIVR